MLRITDFSNYDLVPYKHEIFKNEILDTKKSLGEIFIPKISVLEYENIKKEIRLSAYKLAEKQLVDLKDDLNVPIPKDSTFNDPFDFWGYKAKPTTEYEAELHSSTLTNGAMFLYTIFVCNESGEPICPYVEKRGEISENRESLYGKLIAAKGFIEDYLSLLLDIELKKKDSDKSENTDAEKKKQPST